MMRGTYWIARITAFLAFRSKRRTARHLFSFAKAEHESMLELYEASALCTDIDRSCKYLRHAHDEKRHAGLFASMATTLRLRLGSSGFGDPITGCDRLFLRRGEVAFLAFVHIGERRGRMQFEAYRDHFRGRDTELAALFAALVGDEREHERYSLKLLQTLAGSPANTRRALRRSQVWRALHAWRHAGEALATRVYLLAMAALYLGAAPLAWLLRRKAPRGEVGWRLPEH